MSATQELIAAALAECDLMTGMLGYEPASLRDLREACARAMVQPAAPDMVEVERRLETYEEACRSACDIGQWEPERTALLDYVRGVLAERDALMLEFCPQEMTEVQKEKWARNQQPVGEEPCRIEQPTGWRCTRAGGHEGPCAAVEDRS